MPEVRPLLQVRGLEAGYGARQVLGPVSFDLGQGETSIFIGPGGAGKSTLLRILEGHPATDPDFWCRGTVEGARAGARLVPQKPPAPPGTLGERLREVAGSAVEGVSQVWRGVPEAGEVVAADLDMPLASLPRERLRLARLTLALAGSPALVFLDEPEADLDDPWHSWVRRLLRAARGSTTLVVATHHLELAREASDQVLLLIGGRIVESAATETLFEHPVHPRTRDFLRLGS